MQIHFHLQIRLIKSYNCIKMSFEQLRKLKHYQHLEELKEKPQSKSRLQKKYLKDQEGNTWVLRKLNKSSKKLKELEKSHEIQRNNKILYDKLAHHFKEIQDTIVRTNSATKINKIKKNKFLEKVKTQAKEIDEHENAEHHDKVHYQKVDEYLKHLKESKNRNAIDQTQKLPFSHSPTDHQKVLFYGVDKIDGVEFKIKLLLSQTHYYLMGKNQHSKIMFQMGHDEYLKIHTHQLKGNPCNIFKYLILEDNKVRLRWRQTKNNFHLKSNYGLPFI